MNCRLIAAPMLVFAFAGLPMHVHAQEKPAVVGINEYSVEGQLSSYRYEEPGLMELKGNKGAVAGRMTHRGDKEVFAAGEARLAYGKVDYTSVSTGSDTGEPDYLYEFRGLVGKRFAAGRAHYSPYFGIGWRHLINDAAGITTTTGHYGYLRVSDYYYLPLGIDWRYQLGSGNYIEANAEYDLLLRGTQQSHLSGETIKNTQNRGHGFRASALFGFGPWAIGPFANSWKIADSTVEFCLAYFPNGCYEPKNNTTEAGIRVRYTFQ